MSSVGFLGRLASYAASCTLFVASLTGAALASVHAGDQLQVTVYNHPELSRHVTVDAAGALSLPLAGTVSVQGLETAQIATRIEKALAAYVKYPAVAVELSSQTASVFVSGGPGGVLKYEAGETLGAALAVVRPSGAQAGAEQERAVGLDALARSRVDLHRVGVERDGKSLGCFDALALSARGESGPVLVPGDTIVFVNKPRAVRVTGDVTVPGNAYLWEDEPLGDALYQAGGTTATAASAHIVLQRSGVASSLALGDAAFSKPAENGDVLTVPTAPRVSVVGIVDHPGPVTLKTDFTLLNALYQAGGPTKWADLAHVKVLRNGKQSEFNLASLAHGDTTQNPILQDGDLVFVPEGRKVDFLPVFQALLPFLYLIPRP